MNLRRILLVEDEKSLREAIKFNLEKEGYEIVSVADGKKAVHEFNTQHFDLVVLDIMLPELNGLEVCEQIRLENKTLPILFLTARDTSSDVIKGLKAGGDDYMTKPFNLEEFLLRVRNLLKRLMSNNDLEEFETYSFAGNTINFNTFIAKSIHGERHLTSKEAKLLKLFFMHPGEVVSRKDILRQVWGYDVYPTTRTIDNFILSFRKYFESNPRQPKHFLSVRGVGYKFEQ